MLEIEWQVPVIIYLNLPKASTLTSKYARNARLQHVHFKMFPRLRGPFRDAHSTDDCVLEYLRVYNGILYLWKLPTAFLT